MDIVLLSTEVSNKEAILKTEELKDYVSKDKKKKYEEKAERGNTKTLNWQR
jgi:hypothetical protein